MNGAWAELWPQWFSEEASPLLSRTEMGLAQSVTSRKSSQGGHTARFLRADQTICAETSKQGPWHKQVLSTQPEGRTYIEQHTA